jgi:hypothetical protein
MLFTKNKFHSMAVTFDLNLLPDLMEINELAQQRV